MKCFDDTNFGKGVVDRLRKLTEEVFYMKQLETDNRLSDVFAYNITKFIQKWQLHNCNMQAIYILNIWLFLKWLV